MMRIAKGFLVVGAVLLGGCGDTTEKVTNVIDCTPVLFSSADPMAPPCTVPVNFIVDDSANGVFLAGELLWKGGMVYDPLTRIAYNDGWDGPWAQLYDDGAWDDADPLKRGHEPSGEVADDHVWGVTVFVHPPETGTQTWEYGLVDHAFGDGWIWKNATNNNGTFDVEAGRTAPVTALGMTLPAFGATDVMLALDTNDLAAGTWDTSTVTVKGSGWAWNEVAMRDDGVAPDATADDGLYTFVLSEHAGAGNAFYHTGLAGPNEVIEFVFVLGGSEYKVSTVPPQTGVSAQTKLASAGVWAAATVSNQPSGNQNTYITAPAY